jgi:cytochrome bd-type quinol oxidase subunit 1
MDPLLLSRTQFGALSAFHLLFPILTLTLGWALLVFRIQAQRYGDLDSRWAFGVWMPVYALTAAFQVVSAGALVSQFNLTWPGVMEHAGAVVGPLSLVWAVGLTVQILCLGIAARGFGDLPDRAVGLFVAGSAFGAFVTVLAPVMIVTWLSNPVGDWSDPTTLTSVDWVGLLTAGLLWKTMLWAVALSCVTAGGLMISLTILKSWFGGHPLSNDPALILGAKIAIAGVPATVIWCVLDGFSDHLVLIFMLLLLFLVLLFVLARGAVQDTLPAALQVILIGGPLIGWIAALGSWPFSDLFLGQWAIQGHLRFDQALAVGPPGAVARTLTLYLVTICCLLVSFFAVLVVMARKAAGPTAAENRRKRGLFQPSR